MPVFKTEAMVAKDSSLTVRSVPFEPGAQVEVTITKSVAPGRAGSKYSLRGKKFCLAKPLDGVAQEDWEVSQ